MQKPIKLHPLDNVLILTDEQLGGLAGIGHKIADCLIREGEKIIKYGVPIGSATTTIEIGEHVHLHNMKSDYIPTYTIETPDKENNN
ncbi:UxaA family hydrolase [Pedobacter frigoris]|uniref:UxaA family hydrolase n=1 Tax=Pedobacter frigoris TaxID=2571272 RepID=UPI0029310BDC|nr:UxaA family hydrolase [Pedobacter frigoris]